MTPRQRQDFERIKMRNKFLERFNREQQAKLRKLERDRSHPPKSGLNLLHWLTTCEWRDVCISTSDVRRARSLLNWLERRAHPTAGDP